MRTFTSADDITGAVGETIGTSDWLEITQERVNTFADATGDHQWIHVDVERATKESPFGGPIAHGYLTLSLLPMLSWQTYTVENSRMGVNYGSNKVRYVHPVPVGSRIRLVAVLGAADSLADGAVQMTVDSTIEIEGVDKPALVAQVISRVYF
ncbi:MaoC family dehydratase [Rhodococcus kroppenstedtii]|uniref:Acyl dehydratase n=1 Tax=Rhodococcoides kroppenstedtii TaxID=293050 RepID=A0A1I0TBW1_9NOCA|nr:MULTISPECIES: MaoC family dehydratase [Rhodococcus]AMY18934.1 putative enoyl-CoA hydratase 1 [Rhodococcus sp. PBTS 1]MBT1190868.1 MaoC family dehydratase [Rhodococcus kroppenstedtii]MBY6311908.1 MaoC family dehydratase [Rhodococcus kroppenstedtii]MBY6319492.1 MaoC family dehydratase [Rhodococcus kroppenstedtii]MBY6398175.1 MaoC family dehydratase [Rhodococcus kroppenstedtii]